MKYFIIVSAVLIVIFGIISAGAGIAPGLLGAVMIYALYSYYRDKRKDPSKALENRGYIDLLKWVKKKKPSGQSG